MLLCNQLSHGSNEQGIHAREVVCFGVRFCFPSQPSSAVCCSHKLLWFQRFVLGQALLPLLGAPAPPVGAEPTPDRANLGALRRRCNAPPCPWQLGSFLIIHLLCELCPVWADTALEGPCPWMCLNTSCLC